MEFLVGLLVIVFGAGSAMFARRLREIEQRVQEESRQRRVSEGLLAQALARIHALESTRPLARPAPKPAEVPAAVIVGPPVETIQEPIAPLHPIVTAGPPPIPVVPIPAVPIPAVPQTRLCQFCGRAAEPGRAICVCGAVLDYALALRVESPKPLESETAGLAAPPPLPPPVFGTGAPAEPLVHPSTPPALPSAPVVHVAPAPSLRDRIRAQVGDEGWEAMVGGSWLNKVGVLVLVIGIALLLGYEFGRVGPAGRVAIGLGISLTMLIGGVLMERRPAYAIFARGLIGGGWAALYFTAYAMHAVEASRVIENPFVATGLLLGVAAGMILHSLRYRSQTVSGLAYFVAFATLALGESTPFSVIALIPLAGSLLAIAYRFEWYKMAVFGLLATYATCASRPDTGAPLGTTQALFATYWLLFETFDLMRVRRRLSGFGIESLILPLNALAFLALSIVKWHRVASGDLWMLLAAGAASYLASAFLRASIAPPSRFPVGSGTPERMASGGYEGPITLAAGLAAASIYLKAPGIWINAGLLIEGEVLFLAGLRFGEAYLRQLAGAVFAGSLAKLLFFDMPIPGRTTIGGRQWMLWTPAAIAASAVFYVNRSLREAGGVLYSSAAAALIALVLGYETPHQYLCVAWLVFAALLFEFGYRKDKTEFLFQSYVIGALGTGAGFLVNVAIPNAGWTHQWLPIGIAASIHYAISLRVRFGGTARLGEGEEAVPWVTSASATAFFAVLVWKLAPAGYVGAGWLALGAVLFELGLWKLPAQFRRLSYAVSTLGFANVAYLHVVLANKGSGRDEPVSLAIAALICCFFTARIFRALPDRIDESEREWLRDLSAGGATLFAMTLAWLGLPDVTVALAWGIASLVLLELGFEFALPRFRFFGNVVAAVVVGRLFFANFTNLGDTLAISHRLLTVIPTILSQYYVWSRYRNAKTSYAEKSFARLYLWAPAILGVVLMRFELGRSLTVVGWALLCIALYRTGLTSKLADLRWQSYAIALLAFWRSWNTNFYVPESLGGIRARVLTGAFVIASFYCAQLISPRDSASENAGDGAPDGGSRLDRHARTFYSLLASTLLAVLLFYEVSGSMLTMAWGAEALAVLAAGFPLRDRVQRLSGLFLFMVCVLKLFLYDLRQLETINRILSFIVLGVILVSVSWIYTRFKDRIQRYL